MTAPDRIGACAWHAALALVGTPFRLHGRDAAHGLDCIGLILAAYRAAGLCLAPPDASYRLSGHAPTMVAKPLMAAGFGRVARCDNAAGDIAVQLWPLGRLHLLLCGPDGAVHAHAGLRRVVHGPTPAPDDLHSRWRLTGPAPRHVQGNGGY